MLLTKNVNCYTFFNEIMKRTVLERAIEWAGKPDGERKPLVLQGARQVGKTWILEELGRQCFDNVVVINFERQKNLQTLFDADYDISRIVRTLEIASGQKIVPGKTLIILDEIQEANHGVTSLKYFFEDAPQYHIAAAGSLLGISLHKDTSFPVGKVEFLDIYPMSFIEFLMALDKVDFAELAQEGNWAVASMFEPQFREFLRLYYAVGGMPEAVKTYIGTGDLASVRKVQEDLLRAYDNDFSKHAPVTEVPKIRLVWQSIAGQLAKENHKFIYGALKSGARAAEFENAIQWLTDAGMVTKVTRVTSGELPLAGFEDKDSFKLYHLDCGLLAASAGLSPQSIVLEDDYLKQYKGAMTEQYVCQQLEYIMEGESGRAAAAVTGRSGIYYWKPDTGISEVDFLIQIDKETGSVPVPLEVKAQFNLKAKSLGTFIRKYSPRRAFKCSMERYFEIGDGTVVSLPLYLIHSIKGKM